MTGSEIPATEWDSQDTPLSSLVESQKSPQRALEERQHAPINSGVSYGDEVDMRISQWEYMAHWPPATPSQLDDATAAFPSYIPPSQPLVSSQENLRNGYVTSYHGTEHVGDQQRNVAGPLLSFGGSPQLNKRDWSEVDFLNTGFEDQGNGYMSPEGPQQKRPRVITTTYQAARYPLDDDDQHEENLQKSTQKMDGMEILGWQDHMGIAPLCSTGPMPPLQTETWAPTPQETLPGQIPNQQMYHNGNGDASSPMDLDYKSILEGGDLFAYSRDVEPVVYHTTSFLGAADSCQTYSALEYQRCYGIPDTAATQSSAAPSQCDITECEGEAAEESPCSDAEEVIKRECDTCFGVVSSLLFRMRLAYLELMRGHLTSIIFGPCILCRLSFCWQSCEQPVFTLHLCALQYAFNYCTDLRQSYKLMPLNYANFPPMTLVWWRSH